MTLDEWLLRLVVYRYRSTEVLILILITCLTKTIHMIDFILIQLAQKEVVPPYVPSLPECGDHNLTANFDPQFTREPPDLTPDDP